MFNWIQTIAFFSVLFETTGRRKVFFGFVSSKIYHKRDDCDIVKSLFYLCIIFIVIVKSLFYLCIIFIVFLVEMFPVLPLMVFTFLNLFYLAE